MDLRHNKPKEQCAASLPGAVDPGADQKIAGESESGIDRTLILWMLSKTPLERLRVLQRNANAILRIRAANHGR